MAQEKNEPEKLEEEVRKREKRLLRSRKRADRSVWFGLGMFGLFGWSVAIPTLAATFLGIWIDVRWPSRYSWTLMLLLLGLVLGCLNGWYWVRKEQEAIKSEREDDDD